MTKQGTAHTNALRAITPFDSRFLGKHPLFWPLARAGSRFAEESTWPEVESYARVFDGPAPVRFVEQKPVMRPRRERPPIDRASLYDARIVAGEVPTRRASWHDLANALVWGTFPRAKLALHTRQHRAVQDWIPPGAITLPGARSREMDALAVLDEGGVVTTPEGPVVFGHALYEGWVLGTRGMIAREVATVTEPHADPDARLLAVEEALLEVLRREPLVPEHFPRSLPLEVA